jgi:hypothetical protein
MAERSRPKPFKTLDPEFFGPSSPRDDDEEE